MTIIKLMFAISLTVVPVILSFVEPAAAQRRLRTNTYSQTGSDQQNALAQFNLVNTARDGSEITDSASDLGIGLFQGAIQDFTSGNGEVCISGGNLGFQPNCPASSINTGRYVLDANGFLIFNPDRPFVPDTIPFDADLRAELIKDNPAFEFISYSIVRPGQTEPLYSYLLFAGFGFDPNQAVNNLSYILEENILGKASRAVTSSDGSIELIGGDTLLQNRFEQNIPNAVPEPSATLGALAAVSIGLLFKRKTK
ncbi:hypothetical protein ACX27_28180 [Nostoc piscinale CENA21]|uniref:Uncharacterized protein n=1 Tax=Nostoc piscinale CENA21 TaxID=224013 RepID=A0A0M4SVS0_9NOSO|nr:PEP-CTERM sorting domain-containing protein [Nostoc piscinale]ALF55852.1 hypothetical protein ACX27_28180 [Nostoc piscinale CENA21]